MLPGLSPAISTPVCTWKKQFFIPLVAEASQTPAGLRLRQRKGTLPLKKEKGEKRERMLERNKGVSGSIHVEAKLPSSLLSNLRRRGHNRT